MSLIVLAKYQLIRVMARIHELQPGIDPLNRYHRGTGVAALTAGRPAARPVSDRPAQPAACTWSSTASPAGAGQRASRPAAGRSAVMNSAD